MFITLLLVISFAFLLVGIKYLFTSGKRILGIALLLLGSLGYSLGNFLESQEPKTVTILNNMTQGFTKKA